MGIAVGRRRAGCVDHVQHVHVVIEVDQRLALRRGSRRPARRSPSDQCHVESSDSYCSQLPEAARQISNPVGIPVVAQQVGRPSDAVKLERRAPVTPESRGWRRSTRARRRDGAARRGRRPDRGRRSSRRPPRGGGSPWSRRRLYLDDGAEQRGHALEVVDAGLGQRPDPAAVVPGRPVRAGIPVEAAGRVHLSDASPAKAVHSARNVGESCTNGRHHQMAPSPRVPPRQTRAPGTGSIASGFSTTTCLPARERPRTRARRATRAG